MTSDKCAASYIATIKCRFADLNDWESGRDANIENQGNRFADIERREGCGWDAGARAARPRGGWKTENK